MLYKKSLSLLLMLGVLTTSAPFVYATNPANTPSTNSNSSCQACFNTSPYIDKYIDFGDEIIKTMLTYANKETSVFATPSNANASTQASTQTETNSDFARQLESIADNLNKKAQTMVRAGYVASLVTIEAGFLDSWKSIGPMTQNQAIMRDWTKLDTLGQKIMNTVLDLGNAGVFIRLGFKDGFQERINSIILQYSEGANAIFKPVNGTSFSYAPTDVLSTLWTMNQGLKSVIGVGITDSLNNLYLGEQLRFSASMQDALAGIEGGEKGYYSCAQRLQGMTACSDLGNQAKDSSKAIVADAKKETKNAKKIVTDAVKRLQAFRAKNGGVKGLKPNSKDALSAQLHIDGVRDISVNGGELVQGFWDAWKSVRDDINQTSPFAGLKKNTTKDEGSAFEIGDIATKVSIQVNEDAVSQAVNDALDTAQTNRKTSLFASVDPVTKTFPLITQEIMSAKYKIESSNANSIVQSLGKACDAQCSNVGGKCWSSP